MSAKTKKSKKQTRRTRVLPVKVFDDGGDHLDDNVDSYERSAWIREAIREHARRKGFPFPRGMRL